MPFNCFTAEADFDPQSHYDECVGVLGIIPNLLAPPPDQLFGLVWDSFVSNVQVIANGCTIAYNGIVAAGAAPNYNPSYLAILMSACAGGFEPDITAMDNQMNNSPVVLQNMGFLAQIIGIVYDPYNMGYPAPGALVSEASDGLSEVIPDLQVKIREFLAKGEPISNGPLRASI